VFVHPNPKEPFGIAPLEAMASGVPTVAPEAGGVLTYATNDNVWLVEPKAESFADAIREIVGNEALRKLKVQKALETARSNTRDISTDRLFATYDRLYQDFKERRDLFTDIQRSREFDFVSELLGERTALSPASSPDDQLARGPFFNN
jgi:glycogen synthase